MASNIDIRGLDKAEVLAALYNASKPQGMGFFHFTPDPLTIEDARALIERGDDSAAVFGRRSGSPELYFDYLKGRVMKVDLTHDSFNPAGYDRDNGNGAAERAIAPLRQKIAA